MSDLYYKEKSLEEVNEPPTISKHDTKRAKKREAKHVSSLLRTWRNTMWHSSDTILSLISSKWFARWKAFIEWDEGKSYSQTGTPKSLQEPDYPGPMSIKDLLADDKEYLHNYTVPDRMREKVIKESAEEGRDYFIGPKELYDYLQEKYGGAGILRPQVKIGCNGLLKFFPKLIRVIIY